MTYLLDSQIAYEKNDTEFDHGKETLPSQCGSYIRIYVIAHMVYCQLKLKSNKPN